MSFDARHLACLAGAGLILISAGAPGSRHADEAEASLTSPRAAERESALDRLIETHEAAPDPLPSLGPLLDDADLYVAGKAARALSLYGARAFAQIAELMDQGSPQQRWGATVALIETTADIEPFLPALTRQLSDDDDRVVRATLSALLRLQSRAAPALPALRRALAHEETEIRRAALATFAAIGPAARVALPDLMPFLRDESSDLRLAAAAAVKRVQPPAPLAQEKLAAHIAWLEDRAPQLMREHRVPGVSIAVVQRRELYWAQGFGVRDARRREPVDTQTIFEASSMSKPIMTLGVLRLIQEGRLDLDAPLAGYLGHDYVSDQPGHRRITARMALTHRTGLPNWRIGYDDMGGPMSLLFEPGSEYHYSGEGILFLQRALEAITGAPLERYAQESLFEPLGLTHTSFVWTETIERDLASGHREDGTFKERTRYRKANGAYSLYTTPSDYARLMLAVMRPETLGPQAFTRESVDLLLRRQQRIDDADAWDRPGAARAVASYRALGWSIDVTADGDIVQHSGSNSSGYKTFGQFNSEKGSALVIFTNSENGSRVRDAIIAQMGDL